MNFYYFSFFSLIPLLTIYAIGTALLAWIAYRLLRGKKSRWFIMVPLALLVYIGPIAEELWIAWNFGQLCRKDAGLFVYKTVEVEGFYDDTSGWGPRQLAESKYRFVESKDILYKTLSRVEQADNVSRDQALSWYLKNNPAPRISLLFTCSMTASVFQSRPTELTHGELLKSTTLQQDITTHFRAIIRL